MTSDREPLPALAIRVGVTGMRALPQDAAALQALRAKAAAILAFVQDCVAEQAAAAPTATAHAKAPDRTAQPILRFLSPLAEGADRLVAEEALRLHYTLFAPLPFRQADYETDFADGDSVAAFRALLHHAAEPAPARVLELDGGRCDDETRSYEAVGRLVAQNCDLLIAIWNGKPKNLRGGTGEIMRYAARSGPPVWWIHTDDQEPERLIDHPVQLRQHELAPTNDEARADLKQYLAQIVTPPGHSRPHRPGWIGRCVHLGCRWRGHDEPPLDEYLADAHQGLSAGRQRSPLDPLWKTYRLFMNVFGGPADQGEPMPVPHGPVETYWETHYKTADALSAAYGHRYRSSYILVFLFAGLALIAAFGGAVVHRAEVLAVAVEFVMLLGIAALVALNMYGRWHERWISYRLLAELCRKQRILAPLGRALPGVEVASLAADAATEAESAADGRPPPPRQAWVGWYFAAAQRAAPMPAGVLSGRALHRAAHVGRALLVEQIGYHTDRERRHRAASRKLAHWGDLFFGLTLLAVIVRIFAPLLAGDNAVLDVLGGLCVVLPTCSAALVGIRAYAEFDLLADESERMLRIMKVAEANICDMNFDHPLASQDLGNELSAVAMAMLHDVKGWAQLFRVKAVETS